MKQRLFSETIGIPVITEHSPYPISYVKDILVDPETGLIVAFLLTRRKIIVPLDVIEWADYLLIADESHVLGLEDVVRVREAFHKNIHLVGKKAVTESGVALGRVYNLAFDASADILTQIFVANFFLLIRYDQKIIDRANIVEVRKKSVVVKDLLVKKREKAPVASELSPA